MASRVAEIARQAVNARQHGQSHVTINGVTFNLKSRGYCARFVRQCHEAALGKGEWTWQYNARNAYEMERKLKAANTIVDEPAIGDIIGMSRAGHAPGHIGIYVGDGMIAENTSASGGDPYAPGTKIRPLLRARVSHYYRPLPRQLKIVRLPGSHVIACDADIAAGPARCDLRALAEALGYEVIADHLAEQNKIYLRKEGET